MKNKTLLILILGVLTVIYRFSINLVVDEQALIISMALINVVALGVVILSIVNKVQEKTLFKINASLLNKSDKDKCSKTTNNITNVIVLILCGAIGIIYMLFFISPTLNDVISIFALSLSIADDDLSEFLSGLIFNHL